MKIELISLWYNEEFLAPFFLKHYRLIADWIHIFLDTDTNDSTREQIEKSQRIHANIKVYEFTFPDKMDDLIKMKLFNDFYETIKGGYVILADADEFIFYPEGYLETHRAHVYFTKLWNVYRHHTEKDLDPALSVFQQRRHGVSDFEGYDVYTKPNIVRAGLDLSWMPGHHACWLNGQLIDWKDSHDQFPKCVSKEAPLVGAHWSMADPSFVIERRIKGRRDRQSKVNLKKGMTVQHHNITEEDIRASLKKHENDPQVF